MSNLPVFDEAEHCDVCGTLGAYDFSGHCYCPDCADTYLGETYKEDYLEDDELEYWEIST